MRVMSSYRLATLCLVALGCSNDSTVIATLPPPETKLSQLDADQREMLCTGVQGRARASRGDAKLKHAVCLLSGSLAKGFGGSDADAASACQRAYDDCIMQDLQPVDPDAGVAACMAESFAGCDATVADYADCQEQSAAALIDLFSTLDCDDVTISMDPDDVPVNSPLSPPVCDALYDRCPGLGTVASMMP
jgi:hypothetical protein